MLMDGLEGEAGAVAGLGSCCRTGEAAVRSTYIFERAEKVPRLAPQSRLPTQRQIPRRNRDRLPAISPMARKLHVSLLRHGPVPSH
jgi:hypothetical protein